MNDSKYPSPPYNKYPQSTESLIVNDLGYCCLWVFFQRFKRTALIARRLGLSPRTIRIYKAQVKNGQKVCTNCPSCLKDKIL